MLFGLKHYRPTPLAIDRQHRSTAQSIARADEREDFDAVDAQIPDDGCRPYTTEEIIELRQRLAEQGKTQ